MGVNYSPRSIVDGLLLNIDFANQKSFSTNVVPNPTNLRSWATAASNATLTSDSTVTDSPVNGTPLKMVQTGNDPYTSTYSNSIWNLAPAKAGETWTASVYVKASANTTVEGPVIFGANSTGTFLTAAGFGTFNVNTNWKRISFTTTLTDANTAFVQSRLDGTTAGGSGVTIWWDGLQLEKGSTATSFKSRTNANNSAIYEVTAEYPRNFTIHNPNYWSYGNDAISFDRTTSPAAKDGSGAGIVATGDLTVDKFLYNNHTWEVWFKIDDIQPGVYGNSSIEGYSTLALYQGYHAGLMYTASSLQYTIWSGISTSPVCASWTLGTSGAQVNQGQWYQLAVVRSANTFTPYINGVQVGTGSTQNALSNVSIGTTNNLRIGKTQDLAANTGQYLYYSKNTIGNMKMYNRALTDYEIEQNFAALRGRYGL